MRGIRRRDTKPEKALRSELHRRGFRFRVDFPIPVSEGRRPRADIVFTRRKLAIFVDGCFWHGCETHSKPPEKNPGYWGPKIKRNIERDQEVNARLSADGWKVLRIWEHDELAEAVKRIEELLAE